MPSKAMSIASDSQNPDTPVPFRLTDFGLCEVDSDDAPDHILTPAALQELKDNTPVPSFPLTPLLVKRLAEFKSAREIREKAPKGELGKAIAAEDAAALNLAWALENLVNQERGS